MKVLVTGSAGLIGSEAVEFFDGLGFEVHGIDNNLRAELLRPQRRHHLEPPAPRGDVQGLRPPRPRHPRPAAAWTTSSAARPVDLVVHAAAQPSHDLAAAPPVRRLRRQRRRHAQPPRGHATPRPRGRVHHRVDQQGLRRQPQPRAPGGAGDPLRLRGTRARRGHRRDHVDRGVPPLAVRRLEGGGRRDHPGVRPLLRDAHRGVPRRLPHRARTTPASSSTASSATSCTRRCAKATTRSSATRGSRSATRSTRPT